jgi:outer membrane protein assembly factor BamB
VDFPPELDTGFHYRVSAYNELGESNVSDAVEGMALAYTSTGELADTPWPTFRHDLQGTGSTDIYGPADENPILELFIDLDVDSPITSTPVVNTLGNLIVSTDDGLFEISLPGGSVLNEIPVNVDSLTPTVTDSGTSVFLDQDQNLTAFLPGIWFEAWKLPLGGNGAAHNVLPSATGDLFTCVGPGADSQGLVAYDRTGEPLWNEPAINTSASSLAFSQDGSVIFVGDHGRRVYALHTDDGSQLSGWPVELNPDIGSVTYCSPIAVFGLGNAQRILISSGAGLLYCFDINGEVKFSQILHGIGTPTGPLFSDNTEPENKRIVTIASSDPEDADTFWFYGFLTDGASFWKHPNVEPIPGSVVAQPLICAGPDNRDYILAGSMQGVYYCVDVIDGSDQWISDFGGTGPPATGGFCIDATGAAYFGSTEGRIFKLTSIPGGG